MPKCRSAGLTEGPEKSRLRSLRTQISREPGTPMALQGGAVERNLKTFSSSDAKATARDWATLTLMIGKRHSGAFGISPLLSSLQPGALHGQSSPGWKWCPMSFRQRLIPGRNNRRRSVRLDIKVLVYT